MLNVCVSRGLRFLIRLRVVVTVRKPESSLVDFKGNFRAVLKVLCRIGCKESIDSNRVEVRNLILETLLIFDLRNPLKFGSEGLKTFSLYLSFVHTGRVVVAHFLFATAFCRVR